MSGQGHSLPLMQPTWIECVLEEGDRAHATDMTSRALRTAGANVPLVVCITAPPAPAGWALEGAAVEFVIGKTSEGLEPGARPRVSGVHTSTVRCFCASQCCDRPVWCGSEVW